MTADDGDDDTVTVGMVDAGDDAGGAEVVAPTVGATLRLPRGRTSARTAEAPAGQQHTRSVGRHGAGETAGRPGGARHYRPLRTPTRVPRVLSRQRSRCRSWRRSRAPARLGPGRCRCHDSGCTLTPAPSAPAASSTSSVPLVVEGDGQMQPGGGAVDPGRRQVLADRASTIASRRRRCRRRTSRRWRSRSPVSIILASTSWVSTALPRSVSRLAAITAVPVPRRHHQPADPQGRRQQLRDAARVEDLLAAAWSAARASAAGRSGARRRSRPR